METATGQLAGQRLRIVLLVMLVVQLAAGLLVVGGEPVSEVPAALSAAGTGSAAAGAAGGQRVPHVADPGTGPTTPPVPADAASPSAGVATPSALDDAVGGLVLPDPGAPPEPSHQAAAQAPPTMVAASGPGSASQQTFAREYPTHAAASQRAAEPSTFHWAVIIGVNDYMGRTTSTIGSVGDAHMLRDTLYREGWRGDQVLTLTDHEATHDRVVRAIEWLIRSTDHRSTVVFSFSGHMRHDSGVTALWPADNRFIWAGDLGRMLGAVQADRMWMGLNGCHAAGLAAPGLEGAGRLVTYASNVQGKAYEDPAAGRSVMGNHLYSGALRNGQGDEDGDGRVSVQEAFRWAAPRATAQTAGQQPYGAQRPVLADGLGGRAFPIAVTGAPPTPGAPAAPAAPAPPSEGDEGSTLGRLLPNALTGRLPIR